MRSKQQSAFANPVLVGAVTVLATLVAVFLAYNANQGLPFVPTKQLKVDFADGSQLVEGNDVREGGYRIGLVAKLKPVALVSGGVGAQVTLQLAQQYGDVPIDSRFQVLPRSVLGTKLVDLIRGTSSHFFQDGATTGPSNTSVPVQFDDIFKTFDNRTRTAIQKDLRGFGDTFAARGSDLNDTISVLPQLLPRLERVAGYLSAPSTQLTRFFNSLEGFMGAVAPVAQTNARLFSDMATTFEAISRDPNALQQTIAQSPPTLDVSTDSLRTQQPFLVDLTTFGNALTPATHELGVALPNINPALEQGARTLARTPVLNSKLQGVMNALKKLAQSPSTDIALNALTATVRTVNPMIRYLGPFVTVCNDWNYWWTFLGEHISEATNYGFAQRALLNFPNNQEVSGPNTSTFGQQGATQPMNGYQLPPGAPQPADAEFVHGPTYGAAVDNHGNADCETGQRGYPLKLNHFDPKGRNFETDVHTPGNQGTTWTGRAHVPKGETFTRSPQVGPFLPKVPGNL
jgi:virulence factor Mce-like protein